MILLSLRDLSVAFSSHNGGSTTAVSHVSLDVPAGGSLGVVGESGSGKSTAMMAAIGLLPAAGRITSGNVFFDGTQLNSASNETLRQLRGKRIGVIFQDPMTSLNPYMPIGEQIAEAIRTHGIASGKTAKKRSIALLDSVGIDKAATRYDEHPHQFSGGQRQRILIAMALSCDPDLLIADEPTTALDVTIQAEILKLIKREQQQRQMSLVLISHDLGVVAGMCDHIAVMYGGRVVEAAQANELFAHPCHPYTRGLLAAIPRIDGPRGNPLPVIDYESIARHDEEIGTGSSAIMHAVDSSDVPKIDLPKTDHRIDIDGNA